MFTLKEICDLGIQIERNGERFYRDALRQPWSAPLASMLQMLADEEEKHIDFFVKQKEKAGRQEGSPELEAMGREMLREVLGSQTFSLQDADLSKIGSLEQLRRTAVEFEKDTIVFYEMIRAFLTDEETVEQLDTIIEEEHRHVKLFEGYREKEAGISIQRMNREKGEG